MVTAWSFKRSTPNCLWLHHQKRLHWYIYIRNEISQKNSMKTSKHLRGFRPRPLLGSATGHWPWLAHRPAAQCYTSFLMTHPRWTSRRRVNRLTTRRGNAFLPGVKSWVVSENEEPEVVENRRPPALPLHWQTLNWCDLCRLSWSKTHTQAFPSGHKLSWTHGLWSSLISKANRYSTSIAILQGNA